MPYIGNQHNVGDHVNNFKVLDDISSHTATFDGSATSVVSAADDTIRIPEHRFIQGQRVTYTNGGGGNIGGLTTGTAYFVSFDSANTIKLATTLANANSNTVINLSAVGSGTSHTLNAAFDGVNTKFKMTHGSGKSARLNNATQLNVAINNVIQRPNLDPNNFTDGFALQDNHKIVFKTAPTVNDVFWGSIIANTIENFDLRDNEVDNFTGDGSTTEFTLSTIPANNESVIVSINGVVQHPSDKNTARSYTLIDSIIQFTAAPALGDGIQVRHIGFAGASTNDVSGFYGRTGNVALTSSDNITTGDITPRNINASGIITASTFDGTFSSSVGGSNANFTGIITAGVFKGGDIEGRNLKITGLSTFVGDASFTGNVSIGGTLTYEDVTNIDSVGIITAQTDVHVGAGLSVVGVTTVTGAMNVNNILTVTRSGSNTAAVFSGGGGAGTINIQDGDDGTLAMISVDGGNLKLKTSGGSYSDKLVINPAGNVSITGDLTIPDSIIHSGDTNTKIRFPADDTIQFETSGHDRICIKSNGFIGMGTVTPAVDIHHFSDGLNGNGVRLENREGYVSFTNDANGLYIDAQYVNFRDRAGSTSYASINSSGNLSVFKDLDVDGHTNLDNVSIAGVTTTQAFQATTGTFTGDVDIASTLCHSGDTDTKITFATNTIKFDTDTKERLRIASNGRIGIGTDTNFTALLNLHGVSNTNATTIKFNNTDYGEGIIQHFNGAMYIKASATTGDKLIQFQTAGSARLTIDGNGHIATQNLSSYSFNNDTANAKVFEVTGDGTVGEYGVINISGNQNANNGSVGNIRFVNRENSASNSGGSANSKAVASIQVYTVTSDSNAGDDCGGYMQFITKPEGGGGTGRMIITSGGDVLIADSTNSVYNDSSGGGMNLKASGQIVTKKEATSTADPLVWLNDTGQTTNKFIVFAQDGTEKASIGLAGNDLRFARDGYNETVRIDSSGRLLVGTTQTASKLTVDTDFCVIRGSSDPTINLLLGTTSSITKLYRILIDDSDNDKLQIRDNDTARITMDGSGNLGINNTNPQEKLQIAGNISLGNRGDNTSRYIGKGTDGNGGVIGGASANANSSWIGFISGSGTGQEDQIRFATHKSGVSGGERMRIDGEGIVKIKEKLVILNGGGFSETAPQGLSIRNAGIYLEQGNDITWNNGDNSISGESGYHLSFKTYNGSSNTEKLQISGGSGNAGNWLKTSQAGALFAYDVKSNNSSTCRPTAGDWVYVGSFGYGSNKHGKFVVEWSNISSPGCCHHGYVMLEGGTSYGAGYDYDWSESLKVLHYDAHNSDHFKAWKMVDDGNVLKVFGQWNGGSVASGTFYVTALTGDTYLGDCFYPATPVVDNNSYDGTRLTIDGTFQQGGSGLNPSTKRMQGGSYYGLLHTYGGLDTYGTLSTRGTGAGNGYFGTIWCNYGGISGSGKQAGSFTPYAGQVCPAGSGHQYIHVKFNITGGSMWMMEIMGYEYNGSWTSTVNGVSVTGDKIHHSISGGYHYNNNALFNGKAKAYRGITPGWYISGGYICCYIDTNNTGTSNRHGFYKFAGGVDWIIGRTQQKPTNIIAYSYSTGTSDQF